MYHRKHTRDTAWYGILVAAALFAVASALPAQYLTNSLYLPDVSSPPSFYYSGLHSSIAADFNQNGYADIAYFSSADPTFYVDLDPVLSGVGSYIPGGYGVGWYASGGATDAVAVDVNLDGFLDFVCIHLGMITVCTGNGNGTFVVPISYYLLGVATGALKIIIADANSDGAQDLLCLHNSQNGNVGLTCLLNQYPNWMPAGTPLPVDPYMAPGSLGPVVGDFDGDGNVDVVIQDRALWNSPIVTRIHWGDGTGQFAWGSTTVSGFPITAPPVVRAVYDMNGDGISDLVCDPAGTVGGGAIEQIQVFLGSSSRTVISAGTVTVPVTVSPNGQNPKATFARDFNNDGYGDVLRLSAVTTTTQPVIGEFTVTMALGRPNGQFHQVTMGTPHTPNTAANCP